MQHLEAESEYLNQNNRIQLAIDYIDHEIKKSDLFTNAVEHITKIKIHTSQKHAEVFHELITMLNENHHKSKKQLLKKQPRSIWMLFHAISCGIYRKDLFRCVCHPRMEWFREKRYPKEMLFESKIGALSKCKNKFVPMDAALQILMKIEHKFLQDSIEFYDYFSNSNRSEDPLIGKEQSDGRVLISDGNGRLFRICCEIAQGKSSMERKIDVWTGKRRCGSNRELGMYNEYRKTIFTTKNQQKNRFFWFL